MSLHLRESAVAILAPAAYNHLQGYIPAVSRGLRAACTEIAPPMKTLSLYETLNQLSQQGLASDYREEKPDYAPSDIMDRQRLGRIYKALAAKYVLQPGLEQFTESTEDRFEFAGWQLIKTRVNSLSLWVRLWDAETGEFLWEAAGEGTVAATLFQEKSTLPLYDIARRLWMLMLQETLLAGKTRAVVTSEEYHLQRECRQKCIRYNPARSTKRLKEDNMRMRVAHAVGGTTLLLSTMMGLVYAADDLASWNDGLAKQQITMFVEKVTREDSADFVPPAERIAVFDNDGTLWAEQPAYFQVQFALDRVKTLAPKHPEWKTKQPFKALLEGDKKAFAAMGEKGLLEVLAVSHSGMTTEEFERTVKDWLVAAIHPRFKRPYIDLAYQPMIELLAYLRTHGFKTFIVSGGGVEFMRVWAENVYGIPPEQVVGSVGKQKLEWRDGKPVLLKLPAVDFVDDKEGKPVGIQKFIGRRPLLAFGNSDGDHQMLQWIAAGSGSRFLGLVHHTDAEREWAYDRTSHIGRLDKALDEANERKWVVVDMKRDWKRVFAFQ